MIIIISTFRSTSNPLKLYEIMLFPIGSSAYQIIIQFMKVPSHHYADDTWASNVCHGVNFQHWSLKFSDIVPNSITIMNKNSSKCAKINKISLPYPLKSVYENLPYLPYENLPILSTIWKLHVYFIIIIKKSRQCKLREWYTPYHSKVPSPTIQTYTQKEEKGKKSRRL